MDFEPLPGMVAAKRDLELDLDTPSTGGVLKSTYIFFQGVLVPCVRRHQSRGRVDERNATKS